MAWNSTIKTKINSTQIKKDEETYEKVWNMKPHVCEECGIFLGDDFRNYEGRVNNKGYYSHILTKKSYPQLRDNVYNFNLLCPKHHNKWEFGKKEKMNIYKKNIIIIPLLKKGELK